MKNGYLNLEETNFNHRLIVNLSELLWTISIQNQNSIKESQNFYPLLVLELKKNSQITINFMFKEEKGRKEKK